METMGSSVYCKMFFRVVSDANLKALLIASIVTSFFTFIVISVKEPFGTGTRIPQPPMAEANAGKIFVSAFAAPVVVGTIDCPAARALRRSL